MSHKGKEKVDDTLRMQNLSAGHDDVDGHSSSFDSLDEEFGIPSLKTLGVRRTQIGYRTLGSDPIVCRSGRVKNPVQRLTYDSYVACHCAFMVKIV